MKRWAGAGLALLLAAGCDGQNPAGPNGGGVQLRVTAIQPATGSTFGGTSVTITGTGFTAGASVTIGGTAATSVAVVNDTTLTAVTPQHASGASNVVVSAGGQTATLSVAFTFVTPSTTPNTPPVIQNLTAQGTRQNQPAAMADLGEAIVVTTTVTDPDTASASLTYEWTATVGTFEGTGATVNWRAPASLSGTPRNEMLTVTVIERYVTADSQGLPVNQEHRVTRTLVVRVHDSIREVGDLAREFLLLFSDSRVPTSQVMSTFTDTCHGKVSETFDVDKNRCLYTINSSFVGAASTPSFHFGGSCVTPRGDVRRADACTSVPVRWNSTIKSTALQCPAEYVQELTAPPGTSGVAEGVDYLAAVYEGGSWRLCDSDFIGQDIDGKPSKFKK